MIHRSTCLFGSIFFFSFPAEAWNFRPKFLCSSQVLPKRQVNAFDQLFQLLWKAKSDDVPQLRGWSDRESGRKNPGRIWLPKTLAFPPIFHSWIMLNHVKSLLKKLPFLLKSQFLDASSQVTSPVGAKDCCDSWNQNNPWSGEFKYATI